MIAVLVYVLLSVGLLLGKLARIFFPLLRRYFIPSSIVGGLVALIGGPEVWGRIVPGQPGGLVGAEVYEFCALIPGFLINIVFAALFLGKTIPPPREVWRRAGPQVAFGQAMAWGMYVVGIGLTMVLLTPLYGVPHAFGTLLEIGFEGGHGTAAGLASTFQSVGWAEGTDLALGVATVGVVMGVVIGMLLINWGVRYNQTAFLTPDGFRQSEESEGSSDTAEESGGAETSKGKDVGRRSDKSGTVGSEEARADQEAYEITSIEPISLHAAYIGVAIGIGAILQWLLVQVELQTLGRLGVEPLMAHVPLFPLAMIGGILLQQLHDRFLPRLKLQRILFAKLQGVALDYLIVAALAALSLTTLAANWQPLLMLVVAGIIWIVGMFLLLGPRMLPDYWFERGIGDFGQSMGMTATGLLLLRIVDPDYRSPAFEAFGYKQLLFEPFVGGGLVTAMAVPLVVNYGPLLLFGISLVFTLFWIGFGLIFFRPRRRPSPVPASSQ